MRLFVLFVTFCSGFWSNAAEPYGLDSRPVVGPFLNNAFPRQEQITTSWQTVPAFPNLTFDNPTCITVEPRANRLYVCNAAGRIYFFTNDPAVTTKTLFLDISSRTEQYEGRALLGFVFHPQYRIPDSPNRGHVYVWYAYSPAPITGPVDEHPGYNRLSRFTVPDGSLIADPNSELVLINQYDPHSWHNGGGMFFGPDGLLYVTNGDIGGNDDPYNQAQRIDGGLFAGVFRIDVDMDPSRSHPIRRQPQSTEQPPPDWPASYTQHYYIPNDNPWLDPEGSILEEFYAIGLRSPHRITYDPPTGRMWLGDVGQGSREEVNIIQKGGNYQWSYREGDIPGPRPKPNPLLGIDTPPVYAYPHGSDNCVIGGYVYRGVEHFASLSGKYIFGDNISGRIWAMDYDGSAPPTVTFLCNIPSGGTEMTGLTSFGQDHAGELYMSVMGPGTKIYKLAPAGTGGTPPPALLSQTGAFTDLGSLSPSTSLIPFTVNAPLWSDNAAKFRWMAVPNDGAPYTGSETIGFSSVGTWSFPVGTVLVKHFELPIDDSNPAIRKRLETRFLVRGTNGAFYGLTYKWRADNSDADLLPGGLQETNLIATTGGIFRTQIWSYPSRQDCITCHNANADQVLGVRTCQLNGDLNYPSTGRTDNQLRTLNQIGMFSRPFLESSIPSFPKSASINDTTATLEHRVRSYIDANCAQCHRPNGPQGANFDARFDTPLAEQGIVNGLVSNPLGILGAKVVRPQSPEQSILYFRDNRVGENQMPPLAKNTIDTNYIAVLREWINSLVPPTLTSIVVNPVNPTIFTGASQQFTATGRYSDGSTDNLTGSVNWTSSVSAVAAINSAGLANAGSPGSTTISATLSNLTGTATLTVEVTPLVINTPPLPNGLLNVSYELSQQFVGGVPPYTWSLESGALPSGLALNPNTGAISGTPTAAGTFDFVLRVSDSGSPGDSVTKAFTLTIYTAQPRTLWPNTTVPEGTLAVQDGAVELGVKFTSDVSGAIAGIRFYKSDANVGLHVGNLWTRTGELLASAVFTNETASGWQQVLFGAPVPITSNTVYVASYHCPNVGYSEDQFYFETAYDNPPLHALANGTDGPNAVYAYGPESAFPTGTFNSANYWVDVVFVPQAAATPEVTWPTPADIVYGSALGAAQLNASSPVPGIFTYNPPAGTLLNAGDGQILSTTFTPTDTLAYATVTTNVPINVHKKSLTITANDTVRVYGAPDVFTLAYSGFVNGDTPLSLDVSPIITTDATPSSPIGSYPITVGSAGDANYSISFFPGTLIITRASTVGTLTSSANPAPLGQPVTFTFTASSVAPSTAVPVGPVRFSIDGATYDQVSLVNGVASTTTSALSLGSHSVTAEYLGTPNFSGTIRVLSPDQVINSPPVARPDELRRYLPYGAKIHVSALLSNDSDADGDPISFVAPSSTSTNGGPVIRDGNWISYTAPAGFTNDDAFTYTITDGRGDPVTGLVNVRVQSDPLPSPNLTLTHLGDGVYRIRFNGIPDLPYRIEYADALNPTLWQTLGSAVANDVGVFEILDTLPNDSPQRFYRSVSP